MDLSIIIVNWNSADYTDKCLETIYSNLKGIKFEIIIVDNASYDGLSEKVKIKYPSVVYIQSPENIGFARANNLGYQYSSGKMLLFLNPDTEIIGNAISTMLNYLVVLPDAGAIGCRLLNSDRSTQTVCVQTFPSIFQQIVDFEFTVKKYSDFPAWNSNPHRSDQDRPVVVDVIIGACIMIKREVFSSIGMFSADYFMYAEDIDLCYKIKKNGYKTYYIGDVSIIHHGGGSTVNKKHDDFKIVTLNESVLKFIKKSRGSYYAMLFRATTAIVALFRIIVISGLMQIRRSTDSESSLPNALYKWKKVFKWSAFLDKEVGNK